MKKVLEVLLVALMVLALVGCGKKEEPAPAPAEEQPAAEPEAAANVVTENDYNNMEGAIAWVGGMAISSTSDKLQWRGFVEQLKTLGSYNLVDMGPAEFKQAAQIDKIEECIAQKVAAIVISPVTETGAEEALKKAVDAGIKVVSFNGRAPISVRTTHVNQCDPIAFGEQNVALAVLQTLGVDYKADQNTLVEQAVAAAKANGKSVKIGVISTLPDAAIQSAWLKNIEDACKAYENGIELDVKYTNNDVSQGSVLLDAFDLQGDIKSIICLATNTISVIADEIVALDSDIKLTGCMWASSAAPYTDGAIPQGFGWDFEWWGEVLAATTVATMNGTYNGKVGEKVTVNPTDTYPNGGTFTTVETSKPSEAGGTEIFSQIPIMYTAENVQKWVDQENSAVK